MKNSEHHKKFSSWALMMLFGLKSNVGRIWTTNCWLFNLTEYKQIYSVLDLWRFSPMYLGDFNNKILIVHAYLKYMSNSTDLWGTAQTPKIDSTFQDHGLNVCVCGNIFVGISYFSSGALYLKVLVGETDCITKFIALLRFTVTVIKTNQTNKKTNSLILFHCVRFTNYFIRKS